MNLLHRGVDDGDMATRRWTRRAERSEDGAGLVEYVLLLSLIAVVCIVSVAYFGTRVNSRFSTVGSSVGVATGGP